MMNNIRVYFEESSIHGFPYIVNKTLHTIEKILWIVALLFSFVCCGLLIFKIGMMYREDSMVTYTSENAIAVTDVSRILTNFIFRSSCCFSKVPFPAVTFCPDLMSYNKVFDFNGMVNKLKKHELSIDKILEGEYVIFHSTKFVT
jgi:hypothetical protein